MYHLGNIPQIHIDFLYYNDTVIILIGRPFNLTATIMSPFNLTSLYWSAPEYSDPSHNKTIVVHESGNKIMVIFMFLKNASQSDGGNYTLTAVNECGQSLSRVMVYPVLPGKITDHTFVLC